MERGSDAVDAEAPVFGVVLAGGSGTRFWPASRRERPKQLLPLGVSGRALVVDAVERAESVAGRERVRVVAGEHLLPPLRRVLPDLSDENFLVEPRPRGTGPALAWAAHHVARRAPRAVMLSLHADHRIEPAEAFLETARRTVRAASEGERLYCIGAPPTRAETGYGYVETGPPRDDGVFDARAFVEKPAPEAAREYVASGGYLWNTGLFGWRVDEFLRVVREHTPELSGALPHLDDDDPEAFFREVEPISVDVGVMERAPAVGVVRATFRWDDLGVWGSLARALPRDENGNVTVGPARVVEGGDNVVWSEDGRVVLFGVEGLVVARSGEETLVTTREAADRLKQLLDVLEAHQHGGAGPDATEGAHGAATGSDALEEAAGKARESAGGPSGEEAPEGAEGDGS